MSTIHACEHETSVTNYKKARIGMPCCGKALQDKSRVWQHLNEAKRQK